MDKVTSKRRSAPYSMKHLLNDREISGVDFVCDKYFERFGRHCVDDPDLIVHLGDNPWSYLCWSGTSGKIPTMRTGAGFFYCPHREAWLLPKDKLAALGFPVTKDVALAMGVRTIPIADSFKAAAIAGNSFHFCTVAIVQLVALSCYQMKKS